MFILIRNSCNQLSFINHVDTCLISSLREHKSRPSLGRFWRSLENTIDQKIKQTNTQPNKQKQKQQKKKKTINISKRHIFFFFFFVYQIHHDVCLVTYHFLHIFYTIDHYNLLNRFHVFMLRCSSGRDCFDYDNYQNYCIDLWKTKPIGIYNEIKCMNLAQNNHILPWKKIANLILFIHVDILICIYQYSIIFQKNIYHNIVCKWAYE